MEFALIIVALAGGYVASIYTWPWLRTHATGSMAEIQRLQKRTADISAKLKAL